MTNLIGFLKQKLSNDELLKVLSGEILYVAYNNEWCKVASNGMLISPQGKKFTPSNRLLKLVRVGGEGSKVTDTGFSSRILLAPKAPQAPQAPEAQAPEAEAPEAEAPKAYNPLDALKDL